MRVGTLWNLALGPGSIAIHVCEYFLHGSIAFYVCVLFVCVYFCGTRAALPSMCVCTFYMATLHSELYCPAGRFHQLLHRWLSSIATDGDWRDNAMVLFSVFPFSDIPAFSLACLVCLTIPFLPTNVVNFNNSKSLLWRCFITAWQQNGTRLWRMKFNLGPANHITGLGRL